MPWRLLSLPAVAVAFTAGGCTSPADPPAPAAEASTAAPACGPDRAEASFESALPQEVLTRVEVFTVQARNKDSAVVPLDDQERELTVAGLPEGPGWTPWLLTKAREHHPDLPFDEGRRTGPQGSTDWQTPLRDGRYVEYLGLREVQVGFRVTCDTDRYDGTIRTWDLDLSGLILCGLDQPDMLPRQAEGYCDWS
ncbi:hypothetical protein [Melissospora conviva]|uniref:hypothetical protein n=1 Tax=Melissospora conviva TaxID=3388432 RepID=UPI003B805F25